MGKKIKSTKIFSPLSLSVMTLIGAGLFITGFYFLSPEKDTTTKITGILEVISPSCGPSTELAEDGSVRSGDPRPCDSGDMITVNGVEIQTSSGFTPLEDQFSRDIKDLRPGDRVEVKYIVNNFNQASLDCDSCSVRKID
jgi:hypothetical protein